VVAVPSGFLQEIFARYGVSSEIVPNVVDLGRFHPPAANRVRGAHLVVTRNLEPIYDNATAIRVLAIVRKRLPHARLTIAGTGPELQTLRILAGELGVGDAVDLPGRLDREAVASLYRQADVALNPSTVDNTPNSLLEALASGVPVVSTDVGGVRHIVQDGTTALLVPARDPEAMAGAVLRLLEDPGMANHLAAAGLDAVREYSWPRVLPTLIGAYSKASGRD
jgi:glycosyltransferase involved in cell wall biosynthesis